MTLSVVMITKNEERNLARSLESVSFADEIIVLDSNSNDATPTIAREYRAKVIRMDDWPGFGPQKNRALGHASCEWVLSLDADEWVPDTLANEINRIFHHQNQTPREIVAVDGFWIRRRSIFIDKVMRHGDWRNDSVLRLFKKSSGRFSDDLVHERIILHGKTSALKGFLMHHPVRSLEDAEDKMWRYNMVAKDILCRRKKISWADPWVHAGWSLFRGLVLRLGLLDGTRGFQLAWLNAKGVFIRYQAALRRQSAHRSLAGLRRFCAYLNLWLIDHGFLRNIYDNRFLIAVELHRANQPSPRKIQFYKRNFGIKTIVNLRGANPQLGWYRLEREACEKSGIRLINTQLHSRGLPTRQRIHEVKNIIETMELPALVHCKSGADRAGIFSVLYRHFRLGEPIETARRELHLKYGHFKGAKTGILDFFFDQFLATRSPGQSFIDWVDQDYDREQMECDFQPRGLANFFVDVILRRE